MDFAKEINDIVRKSTNHRNLSDCYEDSVAYSEALCNDLADRIQSLVEEKVAYSGTASCPCCGEQVVVQPCPSCKVGAKKSSLGERFYTESLDRFPNENENEKVREALANLCHEQWSGWMEYLFSKCSPEVAQFDKENGNLIIPQWAVDRWTRQMKTKYEDLPNEEKDSDRKEADKFLALLREENASR